MSYFRVSNPQIIQETIANEVMIVNLANGNYYSLDKISADIWTLLNQSVSLEDIVAHYSGACDAPEAEIRAGIHQFVETLVAEGLLEKVPVADASGKVAGLDPLPAKLVFSMPQMNKYADMQDLLMLDPIHEVDETGWPKPSQTA